MFGLGLRARLRRMADDVGRRTGRFLFDLRRTPDRALWLVGSGRSGTTWLSEVLLASAALREMFEPFHPLLVPRASGYPLFHYQRAGDPDDHLEALYRDVFTGRLQHPRVDHFTQRLLFSGRLVKDIFANLVLGWADDLFPQVAKVLLVRHPFDVALSKMQLSDWDWLRDPAELLEQPELVVDHLSGLEAALRAPYSEFGRFVAVWAAVHRATFRSIEGRRVHVVFYEDFRADPQGELTRLGRFLQRVRFPVRIDATQRATWDRPSRSDRSRFLGKGATRPRRSDLDRATVAEGSAILETFGLGDLYDPEGTPNHGALVGLLGGAP